MVHRRRSVGSVKMELIIKSREAALAAVQVFNNPLITFKSEMFIVNMVIAWTYLLHAYYRSEKIEYRYYTKSQSGRKRFDKTKFGAYKYWELERCLNCDKSPVDKDTANNLRFLIGLRHEIEHQMTTRIDDALSARFQATCLNFNDLIKNLFGQKNGIDKHLSFSLQFTSLSDDQVETLKSHKDTLPGNIARLVKDYDSGLSIDEYNSPRYAYRVLFTQKTAHNPGQADKVIEFISADSAVGKNINKEYVLTKEKEKTKFLPSQIVELMQKNGYRGFGIYQHTQLWQKMDAKNPTKGYGTPVVKQWYWYASWLNIVKQHCASNKRKYKYINDQHNKEGRN